MARWFLSVMVVPSANCRIDSVFTVPVNGAFASDGIRILISTSRVPPSGGRSRHILSDGHIARQDEASRHQQRENPFRSDRHFRFDRKQQGFYTCPLSNAGGNQTL